MNVFTDFFRRRLVKKAGMQYIQSGDFAGLHSLFKSESESTEQFVPQFIVAAARAGDIRILDWLGSKYPATLRACGRDAMEAVFESKNTSLDIWHWFIKHGFTKCSRGWVDETKFTCPMCETNIEFQTLVDVDMLIEYRRRCTAPVKNPLAFSLIGFTVFVVFNAISD